jgi:hypothetical protein
MSFLGTAVEAIGQAVNAIAPGFANLTDQSKDKDYNAFRARLFETPEYKTLADDATRDVQLKADLSKWIKNALGPMQYGEQINKYLNESTNDKLFAFVKFLSKNRGQFEGIMRNLSEIDVKLHKQGTERNEKEVKDLIEALINLQANALLALVKPEVAPEGAPAVAPVVAAGVEALAADIKNKIDAVNELLQVKPLVGGSYADPDLIKYMKYKAKYLKLKSKMQ